MTKPIVVVSSSRSGTNYFLSVLSEMAPGAVVLREVFREGGDSLPELSALTGLPPADLAPLGQTDPVALWDRLRDAAGLRLLALKIFYYHAAPDSPIWDRLATEARIVHLVRRRVLDALVSRELALASGKWMLSSASVNDAAPPALRLDPESVAAFIAERQAQVRHFRQRFRGADIHEICYEEIAGDPMLCAAQITRLTGLPLPRQPLDLPIRKQNTWPIPDIVANYDEIAGFDKPHL